MSKERYVILPPSLDVFAELAFDSLDEPQILAMLAQRPGIMGVQVTIHDDNEWATVAATDGESGATWSTPLPPIVDGTQRGSQFPDLASLVPSVKPLLRVRFDVQRLAKIVAAAARVCGPMIDMCFYPAGSSPARPDGAAPVILLGDGRQGGAFVGFLQPILAPGDKTDMTDTKGAQQP